MKKKVYFVLSSLRAGGSERVFWLLAQHFNKAEYDVSLILLDSRDPFFSPKAKGIKVVNLNSVRVSKSFFKMYRLLKAEKPYAVFGTGGHIVLLLSLLSVFIKIPVLVGREANVIDIMARFEGPKARVINMLIRTAYRRMTIGVCQSDEIKQALVNKFHIPLRKLVTIPNPVLPAKVLKINANHNSNKLLLVVARLAWEKGLFRLLEIFRCLPSNYMLTIAGDGLLKEEISERIKELELEGRVKLLGQVKDVNTLIAKHDLMLLTSYTEGFPNSVVEALSVGVPVVSFSVGGIPAIIENGFNGYVIEQNDVETFKKYVIRACGERWDAAAISADVNFRFGIDKVVSSYENLLRYASLQKLTLSGTLSSTAKN